MAPFLGMARYAKKCIYKRLSIFFAITPPERQLLSLQISTRGKYASQIYKRLFLVPKTSNYSSSAKKMMLLS